MTINKHGGVTSATSRRRKLLSVNETERLRARLAELKRQRALFKTESDSLKLVANSSFGKMGSPYSTIYAPKLLIQVTVTGQLALLMLIERMESALVEVVSANTDGVMLRFPKELRGEVERVWKQWQTDTGFTLEEARFRRVASESVNNYIAVGADGKTKGKGVYGEVAMSKNPQNQVVVRAIRDYLVKDTPVADTIRACRDVRDFLNVRTVAGGAVYEGEKLGRVVRFYMSTRPDQQKITYATNGNQVSRSFGSRPLQTLPADNALPADLDIDWYVRDAIERLRGMGVSC